MSFGTTPSLAGEPQKLHFGGQGLGFSWKVEAPGLLYRRACRLQSDWRESGP